MSKLFDFDIAEKDNSILIGTDEAGRGPLAGPVVAAAVCFLEINDDIKQKLNLVNDSKKLSPKQREYLYDLILDNSINAITVIDVDEIEKINMFIGVYLKLLALESMCEKEQIIKTVKEYFLPMERKVPFPTLKPRGCLSQASPQGRFAIALHSCAKPLAYHFENRTSLLPLKSSLYVYYNTKISNYKDI